MLLISAVPRTVMICTAAAASGAAFCVTAFTSPVMMPIPASSRPVTASGAESAPIRALMTCIPASISGCKLSSNAPPSVWMMVIPAAISEDKSSGSAITFTSVCMIWTAQSSNTGRLSRIEFPNAPIKSEPACRMSGKESLMAFVICRTVQFPNTVRRSRLSAIAPASISTISAPDSSMTGRFSPTALIIRIRISLEVPEIFGSLFSMPVARLDIRFAPRSRKFTVISPKPESICKPMSKPVSMMLPLFPEMPSRSEATTRLPIPATSGR